MDLISSILSALLFYAFVPGVMFTFPKRASSATVMATHALLFALVSHAVMRFYWHTIRERFGNYGPVCPNGFVVGANQAGQTDCVPLGQPTYKPLSMPSGEPPK